MGRSRFWVKKCVFETRCGESPPGNTVTKYLNLTECQTRTKGKLSDFGSILYVFLVLKNTVSNENSFLKNFDKFSVIDSTIRMILKLFRYVKFRRYNSNCLINQG